MLRLVSFSLCQRAPSSSTVAHHLSRRNWAPVSKPQIFRSPVFSLQATRKQYATAKDEKKKKDDSPADGKGAQGGRKKKETSAERIAREEAEDALDAPEREAAHAKFLAEEEAAAGGEEVTESIEEGGYEDAVGTERLTIVKRDLAHENAFVEPAMKLLTERERKQLQDAKEYAGWRKGKPVDPEISALFQEAYARYLASPWVSLDNLDQMQKQEDDEALAEMDALPKEPAKLVIDDTTVMEQGHFFHIYDEELEYMHPEGFMGKHLDEQTKVLQNWSLLVREPTVKIAQRLEKQKEALFKTAADRLGTTLIGDAGCGKSAILTQLIYWARRTGWLVVAIDAEKFVSEGNLQRSRLEPLCFDQPEVAMEFLRCQSVAHADKLSQIPLKTTFQIEGFKRTNTSTLFDLVKFGAAEENQRYSADALVYFRRELNLVTEFPVLIAIDSVNSFYSPSLGFGDPDDRTLRPQLISPEKLTAARSFMNIKDHQLLFGTVVCATTETKPATMKHFKRAITRVPNPVRVPAYDHHEFLSTMRFYRENILFGPITKGTKKYIYYLCSGRGHEIWKYSLML